MEAIIGLKRKEMGFSAPLWARGRKDNMSRGYYRVLNVARDSRITAHPKEARKKDI
jgi:hypothetical protein